MSLSELPLIILIGGAAVAVYALGFAGVALAGRWLGRRLPHLFAALLVLAAVAALLLAGGGNRCDEDRYGIVWSRC